MTAGTPLTLHPFGSARVGHTTTRLADGRVLLLGGKSDTPGPKGLLKEASVWTPVSAAWSAVKPMGVARTGHTATMLADGRVLVTGGDNPAKGTLASVELWDPKSGKWQAMGDMAEARTGHTALLLEDGRVLVVGGGARQSRAEVWDPRTGDWRDAGRPLESRRRHTATRLPDGRVLVLGGQNRAGEILASSECWDPATGEWQPAATLVRGRASHTATLLTEGGVLVAGGWCDGFLHQVELLLPGARGTRPVAPLAQARRDHSATLLPDGRVLVAGGQGEPPASLSSVELWLPDRESWQPGTDLEEGRSEHTAMLLEDGRILLVGGYAASPFDKRGTAEVWGEATIARAAPTLLPALEASAPKEKAAPRATAKSPKAAAKRPKATEASAVGTEPGYHFDRFAQAVATEAVERLLGEIDQDARVDSLRLLRHPLAFWPEQGLAVVEGSEVQLQLNPDRQGTAIPANVDEPDPVRDGLVEKYPELSETLSLSGFDSLPGALWHAAWHDVAAAVREALKQKGIRMGPRFQVDASTFEEADVATPGLPMKKLGDIIQKQLRRHFQDDARLRDVAERCYVQPEKRVWLQRLRDV